MKIETHCHTAEVSHCSHISAKDLVHSYKKAGYDAITITDHLYLEWFDPYGGINNESIDLYEKGYHEAVKEGKKVGLKVYQAAEVRFPGSMNDYLLFGFDKSFLLDSERYLKMDLCAFYNEIKLKDMAFFQAHPFRNGMTQAPADCLDGIEIFNGHPWHNSYNDKALKHAGIYGLIGLSGSDAHEFDHVGTGGIMVSRLPKDEKKYAEILLNQRYVNILDKFDASIRE